MKKGVCAFLLFQIIVSANAFADDGEVLFAPNSVIPNGCNFANLGAYNGPIEMVAVYQDDKITCDPGFYLPANSVECAICPENNYCLGNEEFTKDETTSQGINPCPTGLVSPSGTAEIGGCGIIMHVGDDILYLTSAQQTHPAMAVRVDGAIYYAKMTPVADGAQPVNSNTTTQMHVMMDNVEYTVHDNTIKGEQ